MVLGSVPGYWKVYLANRHLAQSKLIYTFYACTLYIHVYAICIGFSCNCCSVTRCSYLDLVRSLLADHTVLQKMGEFAMTIIPLLQDAQQTISNSSNGAEGEIASLHNVLVSCANLLFTFASQSLEVAPCGMLQAPELCTKCLQHSAPALRYCALQHIQLHPHLLSEERGGIMHSLLVQIFSTETDEDSLALLCDILAKIGDIPQLTEVCAVSLKRAALPHLRYNPYFNIRSIHCVS